MRWLRFAAANWKNQGSLICSKRSAKAPGGFQCFFWLMFTVFTPEIVEDMKIHFEKYVFFFKWVESTLPVYPPSLLNEEFSTSEKAEQDKPTEPCSGSLLAQRSGEARRYHPTCHENLLQTFHDISMQGIAPGHPG